REYFHGRSAESDELLRLVRRELLTVLFGRSGLGKTSLLGAQGRDPLPHVQPLSPAGDERRPGLRGDHPRGRRAGGRRRGAADPPARLEERAQPARRARRFPHDRDRSALLSVVCSELNHKRQQAEPPLDRITPELLEGADREILSGFYERAMAGLDPRARAFVEDELITDRGFRDSHALEDSLALPGVTAGAIDALTRNRLLRVDERQSVRRLELTHDVLTRVVKESRDHRRAREAEEKALAQQRRNRRNAALVLAGTLVAVVLIALAGLAEWKAQRLLRAAAVTHRMANAERLQDIDLDTALLVNLEALRIAPTLEVRSGLIRRFASHPHTSTFLSEHQDEINNVVFSPDSKLLASASKDQTVILWDVEGSKPLARLQGHTGGVESVAFSPDGKRLASASLDQTVILWDVASRKPLATLQGHQGEVHGVAFSPDGKRLASTSRDGTVILWDVAGREPLVSLADDQGWVRKATFSPDGKQLAAASENHTVLVWDLDALLDLDFLKAEACRRANRNLTCDEWEIYIGDDEPYHKACEALPGPERCE
ncbi:MAG TPA: hypothetical protein VGM86_31355, partial [Thermoanaerobaculia bacterium]